MTKSILKTAVAVAALLGAGLLTSAPASAQEYGDRGPGVSFSYDSGGYCDADGCPDGFWDYPVSYCPVYFGGEWYRGPMYYRQDDGDYFYWIHGGWRHDAWDSERPSWACEDRFGPALDIDFYLSHGFHWRHQWRDRWHHDHDGHGGGHDHDGHDHDGDHHDHNGDDHDGSDHGGRDGGDHHDGDHGHHDHGDGAPNGNAPDQASGGSSGGHHDHSGGGSHGAGNGTPPANGAPTPLGGASSGAPGSGSHGGNAPSAPAGNTPAGSSHGDSGSHGDGGSHGDSSGGGGHPDNGGRTNTR